MRGWWALLFLSPLISGCIAEEAPSGAACPEIDGVAMRCGDSLLQDLSYRTEPPDLDEGWGCVIDHDDEAPREFYKLYTHLDGDLGWHWRWPLPDWSHRFTVLTLVEPSGISWAITEYRPEGFVEYPEAPEGSEGEAVITSLALRLDEWVDGAWRPIEGARLDMGMRDGVGYYVWSWPERDGTRHLDIMVPHEERIWVPAEKVVELDGRTVSAGVRATSSSFDAQYWGFERALLTDCTLDTVPEASA